MVNALIVTVQEDDDLVKVAEFLKQDQDLEGLRMFVSAGFPLCKEGASAHVWQALCSVVSIHPCLRFLEFFGFAFVDADGWEEMLPKMHTLAISDCTFNGGKSLQAVARAVTSPGSRVERLAARCYQPEVLEALVEALAIDSSRLRKLSILRGMRKYLQVGNALAMLNNLDELHIAHPHEEIMCNPVIPIRLRTLEVYGLTTRAFVDALVTAMQSPDCYLEKLGFLNPDPGLEEREVERLLAGMLRSGKLKSFGWIGRRPGDELLAALGSPDCKLVELRIQELRAVPNGSMDFSRLETLWVEEPLDVFEGEEETPLAALIRSSSGSKLTTLRYSCGENEKANADLFQAILKSNIENLIIYFMRASSSAQNDLCDLLVGNPACKLKKLVMDCSPGNVSFQKAILEALDGNLWSQLRELHLYIERGIPVEAWATAELAATCNRFLTRNALFRDTGESDKEAYVAKLFLCGPSRSGKTTISTNLQRPLSLPLSACIQRHASTSGIEMRHLSFTNTDKKLLLCDLAGQAEFHAFHHSILRGIDKSMFLVVLKVDGNLDIVRRDVLMEDLIYWLRFIASHKSSTSKRKPLVFVALNFFGKGLESAAKGVLMEDVKGKLDEYKEVLDSGEADIFEVEAVKLSTLKNLKNKFGETLVKLLSHQKKVPGLCEDAEEMCRSLRKNPSLVPWWRRMLKGPGKVQIVAVEEIGTKFLSSFKKAAMLPESEKERLIKLIVSYLHDLGEVLYFEHRESISKHVILNI